jgi:hypothetical protein
MDQMRISTTQVSSVMMEIPINGTVEASFLQQLTFLRGVKIRDLVEH